MTIYTLYLITGCIGGFLGGLLGLGGGIIFVPSLFFIFSIYGLHEENIMQSAVSTSLLCVVISSLSAAVRHYKNNLINWKIIRLMIPGLACGSLCGVIFLTISSSNVIKIYYSILLILISSYMFNQKNSQDRTESVPLKYVYPFSFFTGTVSNILGIGGGTLTTPYFNFHGQSLKRSIGTAAGCGVPIAIFGIVVSYLLNILFGIFEKTVLDFIDYYAFMIVSGSTLIFSYLGASATFKTRTTLLKNIFCIALLVISVTILIF